MNNGEVGAIFGVVFLVIAAIAFAMAGGAIRTENKIENDCDTFGAFTLNDKVYTCALRTEAAK